MPAAVSALVNIWPQIVIYLLALMIAFGFLWREIKRVITTLDNIEKKNSERWKKNWTDHENIGQRVAHIEGKLGVTRPTDT